MLIILNRSPVCRIRMGRIRAGAVNVVAEWSMGSFHSQISSAFMKLLRKAYLKEISALEAQLLSTSTRVSPHIDGFKIDSVSIYKGSFETRSG